MERLYIAIRKIWRLLILFILTAIGYFYQTKGIPILLYHSIGTNGTPVSLSPPFFKRQIEYLKRKGYHTLSLEEFHSYIRSGDIRSRKVILITFDDGLKDNYAHAFPVLKEMGFSAVFFVVPASIGNRSIWYVRANLPDLPILSWDELQDMKDYGMDLQSHSYDHSHLMNLGREEIEKQLSRSKEILEERLNSSVEALAYPFGEYNKEVFEIARKMGFRCAFSARLGKFRLGDDLFSIKRMDMTLMAIDHPFSSILYLKSCLSGTFPWYIKIRRFIVRKLGYG